MVEALICLHIHPNKWQSIVCFPYFYNNKLASYSTGIWIINASKWGSLFSYQSCLQNHQYSVYSWQFEPDLSFDGWYRHVCHCHHCKNTKHTYKIVIELASLINDFILHTQFSSITFLSLPSFSFIIKNLSYQHKTKSYPFLEKEKPTITHILGDPGAVSQVDKMFVVKVYCKIETNLSRSYSKLSPQTFYLPD